MDFDAYLRKLVLQGLTVLGLFIGAGVYLLFFVKQEAPPAVPPPSTFWNGKTFLSEQGYILTENFLPLRALARRPNVRLFRNPGDRQAMDVIATMEPWRPYYVYHFSLNEGRMQIGTSDSEDKYWVSYDDCFCWPTRECVNIEALSPVYRDVDGAKANNPIEAAYAYRYSDHFRRESLTDDSSRKFTTMAALPVVGRVENVFWCVLRPEGDADGYQKCWIHLNDASPAVAFRIRTSRDEWARYLTDLYNLQNQYRNRARSEDAKQDMLKLGVSFLAFNARESSTSIGRTYAQAKGILKPTGGIQDLLRNDMEYEKFRDKCVKLIEFDSTPNNWDADVAFPEVSILP